MNEAERRDGAMLMYTTKEGETVTASPHGLLVCHPDRPPKLVRWDGSEQLLTTDAD